MTQYSDSEKKLMRKLAFDSISYGLEKHQIMPVKTSDYNAKLQQEEACFVTLNLDGNLRGCIGSLQAHQSLVEDIVHNAYAAAFGDKRFFPITQEELEKIDIQISILSKPEPIQFDSEADLLKKIRPNVDGLILTENTHCGTFLPTVWESLPNPQQFLNHLKLKAGLKEDYWSDTLKVERYTTEKI